MINYCKEKVIVVRFMQREGYETATHPEIYKKFYKEHRKR